MKIKHINLILIALLFAGCTVSEQTKKVKPTIFTIGDSTVKNGSGRGDGGLWGWGDPIVQFFDTSMVNLENHALGGTSSRSYRSKGLWDEVLEKLQPGDYVLMQFGHNDAGAINDTIRARGTIKGIGEETEEIDNMLTGEHEIVHSYGWYLRQFVKETRAKGAIPVIIAPIPRNDWEDGKVKRNGESYGGWAKQIAESEGVDFINLNQKMADVMDAEGAEEVMGKYFYKRDHTHTSARGAVLSASKVVEGIKELKTNKLKSYLLENPVINFPVKRKVMVIGDSTVANGNDSIVGWGKNLALFLDTARLEVINKARGGRSTRSYCFEGLWDEVLAQLNKDDILLIQFGHNDGGNIDKPKYRGSIPGMGEETDTVQREDTVEIVHSYGWYMKKYISEAKAKGAEVVVISMIPRNQWVDGKVKRENEGYGKWAKEAAQAEGACFADLNEAVAKEYEEMGTKKVKEFFPGDHTHTNADGAVFNAKMLATIMKNDRNCPLRGYVNISK